MGITQGGFNFGGSNLHGDLIPAANFDPQVIVGQFFGVRGEAHLLGDACGRDLTCDYMLSGFLTSSDLDTAIKAIEAKIGVLTGTVALTGNIVTSQRFCTFLAYERGSMQFDGSGVNGWLVRGRLRWRQQRP